MHDFKKFPELTNRQAQFYYFESPHKQIFENFPARCTQVTDGDTIRVTWQERDFDFPIRLSGIAAAESQELGGREARDHLAERILGEEVYIIIDKERRVGKFGRILGRIIHGGQDINEEMIRSGNAVRFDQRNLFNFEPQINFQFDFNP